MGFEMVGEMELGWKIQWDDDNYTRIFTRMNSVY